MSFIFYDIIFLILFIVFFSYFLHSRKKNLKREGLLILYRTTWGIKLIDRIGKKFTRTLYVLSYISITIGYILMVGIIYLIGKIVYIYATRPDIVQAIKVPPLLPLVPYIDKLVPNLGLPSFYFTYFIIVIAIIAITHEMAHGILMRRYNIKIKSTGFAFFPWFLPIIPAAFVEQDEKSMNKSNRFHQMAVLSAGTFANVLTAILFFLVIFVFFIFAFAPSGVIFDSYPYSIIGISGISMINGVALENPTYGKILDFSNESGFNKIRVGEKNYVITKNDLEKQKETNGNILLYYDAPAINANLESIILKINGEKIKNIEDLQKELSKYSPGDKITLNAINKDGNDYNLEIILGENPEDKNLSWLGVGFFSQERSGGLGKIYSMLSFKDPHVYYESKFGDLGLFIYDLLWWIILISISVALINMLPVGIFDGGRFFYLTVLAIVKNESKAEKAFKFSTYFILFLFLLLMLLWAFSFI